MKRILACLMVLAFAGPVRADCVVLLHGLARGAEFAVADGGGAATAGLSGGE
ncbi:MAG: hypothetical protein V9G14_06020 [Cypionkella sp.]